MEAEGMEPRTAAARRIKEPRRSSHGRDELNLAEFPVSVLPQQQRAIKHGRNESVTYSSARYDSKLGRRVPQMVTLTAPAKYGLPTPVDELVILAFLHIAKYQNDFAAPEVYFVPFRLIQLLGWADNGKSYRRLELALDRLTAVTIKYENAWWEKEGRKYRRVFTTGIIAEYELVVQERGPRKNVQPQSFLTWRPRFFEALTSGSLKKLDLQTLFALNTSTGQRMYRFLDKRFYGDPTALLTIDLHDFACGHMGLAPVPNVAELKRRLQPAIRELEEINFIEPATAKERFHKLKAGKWEISFRKTRVPSGDREEPVPGGLHQQLTDRGVTEATAHELVDDHSTERIAEKIELFDWLQESNDRRISENPPGYLVEAIRKDYQLPPDFKTAAQREAEAEAKRQKQTAERRQIQAEEARLEVERSEDAALDRRFDSLSEQERADILASVLAANDHYRKLHRQHPDSVFVRIACRKELKRRLAARE